MHFEWKVHNTHMNTINKKWACLNPQMVEMYPNSFLISLFFNFIQFFIFSLFSPMWICQWQLFSAHSKQNTYKIDTLQWTISLQALRRCVLFSKCQKWPFSIGFSIYMLNMHSVAAGYIHAVSIWAKVASKEEIRDFWPSLLSLSQWFWLYGSFSNDKYILFVHYFYCSKLANAMVFVIIISRNVWSFMVDSLSFRKCMKQKFRASFNAKNVLMTWINDGTCILNRSLTDLLNTRLIQRLKYSVETIFREMAISFDGFDRKFSCPKQHDKWINW